MKTFVVMPAYNEASRIKSTLDNLQDTDFEIVVVDDGSADNTAKIVKDYPVNYLRHETNLGQGAALLTGTLFCLQNGADIIAHFDADGQHRVEDLKALLMELQDNLNIDIALGTRFAQKKNDLPAYKKVILLLAKIFSKKLLSLHFSDPQSGLRAFRGQIFPKIAWQNNDFLHCSEILGQIIKNQVKFKEMPIVVNYNYDNQNKKQRPTIAMGWKLLLHKITGKL